MYRTPSTLRAGFALIEVVVAAAIAGILALVLAKMVTNTQKGTKSSELHSDLITLRKAIGEGLDCGKTLGVPPAVAPLACTGATVLPILRSNGSVLVPASGKIGVWTLQASCVGNQILFTADKPGTTDPLTGQPWATSPALTDPTTHTPDLFRGTSNFCSSFFTTSANWVPLPVACFWSYKTNAANGPNDKETTCRTTGDVTWDQVCQNAGFTSFAGQAKGVFGGTSFSSSSCIQDGGTAGTCGTDTFIACLSGGNGVVARPVPGVSVSVLGYSCPTSIKCQ